MEYRGGVSEPRISLPGSKSIAARLLMLDYINERRNGVPAPRRAGMPDCDDTRELSAALDLLRQYEPGRRYDLGSGGTSMRFFIALVASMSGFEGTVDCSEQLRRRPVSPLVDALRRMGAEIRYLVEEGRPPLYIRGIQKWPEAGADLLAADPDIGRLSSQYISAIILASCLHGVDVRNFRLPEGVVSRPYVDMTLKLVSLFHSRSDVFSSLAVEPDWSAVAFFYELALLRPELKIIFDPALVEEGSLQGDSVCAPLFAEAATRRLFVADMSASPDLVPPLAVGLAFAGIPFRLEGVAALRYKESDRIAALTEGLARLGYKIEADGDYMEWSGEERRIGNSDKEEPLIESRGDHRMAMAFAVSAARFGPLRIRDAECVAKSFPGFFDRLRDAGFSVETSGWGWRGRNILRPYRAGGKYDNPDVQQ